MSRNLSTGALAYLETAQSVKIAHLVRLELAESTEGARVYTYLTDYSGDITLGPNVYEAGKVTKIGDVRQAQGLTNYKLSIEVAGEFASDTPGELPPELAKGLVDNKNKSYVGRDVEVLKAYIDLDGTIVDFDNSGGPMKYFVGDITNIDISEGVVSGVSTVRWECAGKFADFEKISGRVTDDTSHRGLIPDPITGVEVGSDGASKVSHQTDTGFQHANQTINVVSKFLATETRYKMKKRKFWKSPKLVEYEVEVEKEVELGVDLSAKFLPKVYGVRKVPGIPVFIDSVVGVDTHVYVVYAFAEGEIDAFLNFFVEGESIICSSSLAKDICLGNQAAGDTVSAFMTTTAASEVTELFDSIPFKGREVLGNWYERTSSNSIFPIGATEALPRTTGTTHTIDANGANEVVSEFTITNETGTKKLTAYHGKSNQNVDLNMKAVAAGGNFSLQAAWVAADPDNRTLEDYWGDNCKLLDTAYVVLKIAINEDETEIPQLDAVISGSLVSTFDIEGVESKDQYTLNPVWQTLAYMLDPVCGGGMSLELINLRSFYDVAQKMEVLTDSYDNDFLTYWRYVGWKEQPIGQSSGHDPQKIRMQTNMLVNTEDTVTKNLEGMLSQFDATLNILGGKYHISVESIDAPIADISISDVIGSIKTKDLSNKNKWNSIQASITDPGLGWGTNQINFFDQDYLDADNGIKKKGNIQFRHLTNYYTAREWAKVQLAKSRYSREISFTTYYKFTHLFPNANVRFSYDRFGYDNKDFRVKSTTMKANGLVDVVLEDFDASIFDTTLSDDRRGESASASKLLAPPSNLEYVALPNADYVINTSDSIGTQGILLWDVSTEPLILRSDVRDWLEQAPNYSVPLDRVIVNGTSGAKKNYILIHSLVSGGDYTFKVRSIAQNGRSSKYSVANINAGGSSYPISYSPVTGFLATNATGGLFNGGDLSMLWDEHVDPLVSGFELAIRDDTDSFDLRNVQLLKTSTTYTHTLTDNIADYSNKYAGASGAFRTFIVRIRATNGLASNHLNFRASSWETLI